MAQAQTYPSRPVRIIVGFAAGGTNDIFARLIGQWLSENWASRSPSRTVQARGGNIAAEAVVRARADGYTLYLACTPDTVNATLYDKLNFSFVRDIAPVASIMRTPLVVVVNTSVPVKTVAELIAYAKVNPRRLNMGSARIGSPPHVAGELFKMMAGVDMQHVPYRGGAPAVSDLIGGQVQTMFAAMPDCIEHVRAGRLRGLAVTTAMPSEALPGIPTVADVLPGYDVEPLDRHRRAEDTHRRHRREAGTRRSTGPLLIRRSRRALPTWAPRCFRAPPTDFAKLMADETEKWGKVIRAANIKVE